MSTSEQVGALMAHLVDDAGLFPPTALSMPDAVARHRRDRAAADPVLTHRFLCPASRVGELRAELGAADQVRLGVIADTGAEGLGAAVAAIHADPALGLAVVEFPLARTQAESVEGTVAEVETALRDAGVPAEVPVFVEPRTVGAAPTVVRAVHERGEAGGWPLGVKLRCGGVRADLFPTAADLGAALVAAARAGVPVKATAGLHHAIRHTDSDTGFTHHGFLNLLAAAVRAASSGDPEEVTGTLLATDPGPLLRAVSGENGAVVAGRALLTSYGSCSTSTPLIESRQLGLVG